MEGLKSPEVGKSESPEVKKDLLPLEVVDQVASCYDLDVAIIFGKRNGSVRMLSHGRGPGDRALCAHLSQVLRNELGIPVAEANALQLMQRVNREMYRVLMDLKTEVASIVARTEAGACIIYPEEYRELCKLIGRAENSMVLFEKFDRVEEVANAGS